MYRHCTTEKTAKQQKLFIEALFSTMEVHLYQNITISDLCVQTGLTRNIFYRLFNCKDDVLYALIDNHFYACSQAISSKNLEESLLLFFKFWKKHKNLLHILEKNQLNHLLATRGTLCCGQTDFGMQKYIHTDWNNFDTELFSFYVGGFIGLLYYWYHHDFSRTENEMVKISYQLLSIPALLIK